MDSRHTDSDPLRMMLLGSAGTGKSRTNRSFVSSKRNSVREEWEGPLQRAQLGAKTDAYAKVKDKMEEHVRNACVLAAPTGCASFQLRFGASTLHRVFGIPVGYCGPWKNRADARFLKIKTRMDQARLFVVDEMSMVGRQMLGKIEYRLRNTLRSQFQDRPDEVYLAGKNFVLSGDPKQANPIGDEPLYREGDYTGKGQNKPRGSDGTPDDAWDARRLAVNAMGMRHTFKDAVLLRQVHRYVDEKADIPEAQRAEYRRDAQRFLDVTRGMADCKWTREDHAWLSRRNRSILQQTEEGREELRKFKNAPLLMDGRKTRVTGEVGAN